MLQRIDGILHNHTPTAYEEFTEISVAVLLLPPDPVPAHNGASTSSCWHEAFHYSQGNDSTTWNCLVLDFKSPKWYRKDMSEPNSPQIHWMWTECGMDKSNEKWERKSQTVVSVLRWMKKWKSTRGEERLPAFWNLEVLEPWVVWNDKSTQLSLSLWPK